jgi:DNA replicative helicase MCM subunit Mcm2 (Cdc46/Mcm family)
MINPKDKSGVRKISPVTGTGKQELKQGTKQNAKPDAKPEPGVEIVESGAEVVEQRKFGSIFASILPMREEDKTKLAVVQDALEPEEVSELKYLLKTHKARFAEADFGTSHDFFPNSKYLTIASNVIDEAVKRKVEQLNQKLSFQEKERVFRQFAPQAEEKIFSLIAPHIVGLGDVKRAGLIQMFAKDKVHILLLGDPATGKTDILRSISELAPISSYGLGSGTSKAGLTMAVIGKDIAKGLLPLADNGIACIDELNLLRTADRAGLFNAMEKGFITYDKADSHLKLDARVKIFATANPEGERFVGRTMEVIRKQIPFDAALLSRFHLVFLIRKPGTKEFMQITDTIISGSKANVNENDKKFVREYVKYALSNEVELDKSMSPLIQGFVEDIKKDESEFIMEISPRTVIGIMNMAKAAARIKLKDKVEKEDIIKVLKVFNAALYIKKDER